MSGTEGDEAVQQATAIAMDRYQLSEANALQFLERLARRRHVTLPIVALAVIAAAVSRRTRLVLSPRPLALLRDKD